MESSKWLTPIGYVVAASLHYWRWTAWRLDRARIRRKRLAREVIGVGRSVDRLETALRRGAIDRATDDILDGARDADLVIACTPVQTIVNSLELAASVAKPDVILTDVGSTKQSIIKSSQGRLSPINLSVAIRLRVVITAVWNTRWGHCSMVRW